MGTKKKTKTTVDFSKPALSAYESLQPQIQSLLSSYLNTPLLQSPFFQQALSFGSRQAQALGRRGTSNIMGNMAALGFGQGAPSGLLGSQLARAGRATSGLQSNAFWNAFMGAEQNRLNALAQAGSYRPLQTGQTVVEKTSGLGTWLPQTLGMAASIGLAPFTGGASLMGLPGGLTGMGTPRAPQGWSSLPATPPGIGGMGSWFGSIPSSQQLGGLLGGSNLFNLPPLGGR